MALVASGVVLLLGFVLLAVVPPSAASRFTVTDETVGSGSTALLFKVLKNTDTGEYVEVIPELGGKTEALVLVSKSGTRAGELRQVLLDHHRNVTDIRANVGWKGAMLIPYANRIKNGSYTLNGKTYYMERNEDRGKYGKIGLHGYLYKHAMTVAGAAADDVSARLTLVYAFDGSDPGYPFPLHVNITYTLSADGFRVDTRARNVPRHSHSHSHTTLNARGGATTRSAATGSATSESAATAGSATTGASSELEIDAVVGAGLDAALELDESALDVGQPLPFFNGWHSYFKVGDISKAVLTLDRCSKWNHIRVTNDSNVDSDLIPTGLTVPWTAFEGKAPMGGSKAVPTYYDDEFKATSSTTQCPVLETSVRDGDTGDEAVLWQSSGSRFVQVFSGTKKIFGEDAIAVEAMSSEADAWNNMQGVNLIQAGETWDGSFGVRLQ